MALKSPFANDALTYGFEWLRAMFEASLQEGALNLGNAGTDFKATVQTGTMRIDVAAGGALVKGDSGTPGTGLTQGLYLAINDAAIVTAVTLDAADATNPRIDQIVLRVNDSSDLGSSGDTLAIEVVKGTATGGATLDNRNGAAALPNNCLRLRDQLVPAAAASLLEANGRDRRPWARGAYAYKTLSTSPSTGSGSSVEIDTTTFKPRLEVGANPVRVSLAMVIAHSAVAGTQTSFYPWVDGAALATDLRRRISSPAPNYDCPVTFEWYFTPAAGSHTFSPAWNTGSPTVSTSSAFPAQWKVEEILRPDTANG